MRRVVFGGVIGGLPGMLIALVPLLMHDFGLITSDQSQIGFIGVPLLFIGVFVGTLIGAAGTAHIGKVMFGVTLGFFLGLSSGVAIAAALRAAGSTIPGIWLFLAPVTMIACGALGAWWGARDHATPSPRPPANQSSEPRA